MGGLPPTGNEQNIATFFSNALAAVGGTTAGPGMWYRASDSVQYPFLLFAAGFSSPQCLGSLADVDVPTFLQVPVS